MKRIVLAVLLAAACSGQMCVAPAENRWPNEDAGSQMGIPAGVYSGLVSSQITISYAGPEGTAQQSSTQWFTVTKEFGAHGGLLNASNLPLSPGDGWSDETGSVTVESVFIDWGKVIVVTHITTEMPDVGFGEPLHLSGMETITYTDLGNGQVRFDAESRQNSQVIDLQLITYESRTTGILKR